MIYKKVIRLFEDYSENDIVRDEKGLLERLNKFNELVLI